jgi:hypothetical protein
MICYEQASGKSENTFTDYRVTFKKIIKRWTKPATPVLIIGILSDMTRSHTDLVVENALLRQQLIVLNRQIKRPQLTNLDRFRLVFLSHFTTFWKQALSFNRILCCAGIGISMI